MAKSLARLFRRFITSLLWLVSIIVIIFVLLLSVIKLSLPYWTENKPRMVALIEQQLGGDFDYQNLEVDWSEFKPKIFLQNASWASADGLMSYRSESSLVVLNVWESLFKGYLITENIELNNAQAEVMLTKQFSDIDDITLDIGLLLKRYPEAINQESIQANNISLTLQKDKTTRKIQVESLEFNKIGQQRQLVLQLQSDFASDTRLIIESEGKPFDKNNSLAIYGLLRDFDLVDSTEFFSLPHGIPVELVDGEFWIQYKGETPVSGRLLLNADSSESRVAKLDTEINYLKDDTFTMFSSDRFYVVERLDSGELKEFDSYFKVVRQDNKDQTVKWTLEAENTPIGYFSTLSLPFVPENVRQRLLELKPKGELVSLDIEAEQFEQELIPRFGSAKIIDFSSQATDTSPQLTFHQININDEKKGWRVRADSAGTEIIWPGVLEGIIPVDSLNIDFWASFQREPLIHVNQWSLANKDLEVVASGAIRFEGDDVDLSLYGEAYNINVAELHNYWPRNEMEEDVLEFLDRAFVAGAVDSARLTWRGNFENFPYEDNTGLFDLRIELLNGRFNFDPEWPLVEGLSAQAQFKNNQLLFLANEGTVVGNPIGNVNGVIESLFTPGSVLKADIENQINYLQYRELFLNSPLQEWLGPELLDLKFSGSLSNQLHLNVPLSENSPDTTLSGVIYFNGQEVSLDSYQIGVDNLKGQLHYTERGAYAKGLSASLWQNPVTINISADEYTENGDLVDINANSNFDLSKAVTALNMQLPVYVGGRSQVNLHYRQDSEGSESMIVRSDLKGTEIKGPGWLSKSKESASSFLSTLYRKDNRIHVRTIYRDTISSQLDFGVDTPSDINGVIAMGELATHSVEVPETGVAIEGFFAEIHSNEWINSLQVKKEGDFYWPQWIDHIAIRTALFTVVGQSLHDVELTDSLLDDNSVRFNVAAREGFGNLTLYKDGRKHVTVEKLDIELKDFSRLSDSEVSINKSSLDNWQLECLSCKINGIDIGKLTLVSHMENDAIIVKGDSQIKGQLSAYLEAHWRGNQSDVGIEFSTDDTGGLLQRWGYGDGVKKTKAIGDISLNWIGGFHDISLQGLNGSIHLETGEGAVKELSDRQARVFSLFSLQSIRRRLSLDFSDLFEDGFFYDKMKGAFTIKNGVVHSDDVFIDGTAADVRVKGAINLVDQTVNQNVTVVPKLGSSLPILAGWALEPTTGLIMLIVNKIFEPVIDVVVSIEYKVSGDLSNPQVVELSKESKEVTVPEVEEELPQPEKATIEKLNSEETESVKKPPSEDNGSNE